MWYERGGGFSGLINATEVNFVIHLLKIKASCKKFAFVFVSHLAFSNFVLIQRGFASCLPFVLFILLFSFVNKIKF